MTTATLLKSLWPIFALAPLPICAEFAPERVFAGSTFTFTGSFRLIPDYPENFNPAGPSIPAFEDVIFLSAQVGEFDYAPLDTTGTMRWVTPSGEAPGDFTYEPARGGRPAEILYGNGSFFVDPTRVFGADLTFTSPTEGTFVGFRRLADDDGFNGMAFYEGSGTFTLTSPSTPPTISEIEDQVYDLGNVPGFVAINFTVGDAETPLDELEFTITSSDQRILPDDKIEVLGVTESRQLILQPSNSFSGISTITVEVSDGILSSVAAFDLVVPAGRVLRLKSENSTVTATGSAGHRTLQAGDPVFEGDLIVSGAVGDGVILKMADGTQFGVFKATILKLDRASAPKRGGVINWITSFLRGKLSVYSDPKTYEEYLKWKVRTPTAVLGKRGTTFTVDVTEDGGIVQTSCSVDDGLVLMENLSTGAVSSLGPGESLTISSPPVFSPDFEWTGPKQGVYDFFTETGNTYSLLRSTDLSFSEGSTTVVDSVVGDGLPASLSFDDSESPSERAFFRLLEEQN